MLFVFCLSVAIRIPNINRPLSKHHEFATGISLRVITILGDEGLRKYNFNPVMNFPGRYNKFMNNHASTTGGIKDAEGNYYYISHPPCAYILPHWVHKIIHIKPSVLSLQLINLFINLISAIFMYFIICLLFRESGHNSTHHLRKVQSTSNKSSLPPAQRY